MCFFVHNYTSATLFCSLFISVFRIHLFLTKIAILVFESTMIQGKQLAKHLTFNLLHKIVDSISINKSSFFSIMRMQVKIMRQPTFFDQMVSQLSNCIDCRLLLGRRVDVIPIEVLAESIHSKMTMIHPIDIYHWNYHKYEHLLQQI